MSDREELDFELHADELDSDTLSALESMSLDELLASTKADLARVDALMGEGALPDDEDDGLATAARAQQMPLFEPEPSDAYTNLSPEQKEAQPDAEPVERVQLAPGLKMLLYVCCVLAASVLLAVIGWRCADDVLALTKPDREVSVTVSENETIAQLTEDLKDKGLIEYGWLFKFYCLYSHAENKIEAGTYTLNNMYDYHALVNSMRATSAARESVQITIPEGYECEDIFSELAEKGVCTMDELKQAAAEHEFEYDFLQELPYGDSNRLEGYLFPDTYQFYVGDDPVNVLDKFLKNFDKKLTPELRAVVDEVNAMLEEKMTQNGFAAAEIRAGRLTLHDIITVASLVEKETAKTSESASIASVIYNRLCSKLYPCLQIDATIQYVLPERKEVLSNADKSFISPYNTYTNAGLPAGPIANPGINSIRAALYPADTEYYFYALGKEGVHVFSRTYYEHQEVLGENDD